MKAISKSIIIALAMLVCLGMQPQIASALTLTGIVESVCDVNGSAVTNPAWNTLGSE